MRGPAWAVCGRQDVAHAHMHTHTSCSAAALAASARASAKLASCAALMASASRSASSCCSASSSLRLRTSACMCARVHVHEHAKACLFKHASGFVHSQVYKHIYIHIHKHYAHARACAQPCALRGQDGSRMPYQALGTRMHRHLCAAACIATCTQPCPSPRLQLCLYGGLSRAPCLNQALALLLFRSLPRLCLLLACLHERARACMSWSALPRALAPRLGFSACR